MADKRYIDREDLVEIINKRIELTNPDEQEWVKDECIRQAHCMSAISPKEFYKMGIKDFAEKLKETPIKCGIPLLGLSTKVEIEEYFNDIMMQVRDAIDTLVKEMVEGGEG